MKSVDEKASGGISSHRRTQSGGNSAFLIPSSFLPKSEALEDPSIKTTRRNVRVIEHSPENVQVMSSHIDLSAISLHKKTVTNSSNGPDITRSQTERSTMLAKEIQQIASGKPKDHEDEGNQQKANTSQQQPQKQQLTLAQKHAMVESVRKKWTVDKLQPSATLSNSNSVPTNITAANSDKPQKILISKKRNLSRPTPLNEIDEVLLHYIIHNILIFPLILLIESLAAHKDNVFVTKPHGWSSRNVFLSKKSCARYDLRGLYNETLGYETVVFSNKRRPYRPLLHGSRT